VLIILRKPIAFTVTAACLFLTACAGQQINDGMNKLQGQPIGAAIAKLGIPTEERTVAGEKVYIWSTRLLQQGSERNCVIRVMMRGDVIASYAVEGTGNAMCMDYASRLQR
jgi:hypothetical protein